MLNKTDEKFIRDEQTNSSNSIPNEILITKDEDDLSSLSDDNRSLKNRSGFFLASEVNELWRNKRKFDEIPNSDYITYNSIPKNRRITWLLSELSNEYSDYIPKAINHFPLYAASPQEPAYNNSSANDLIILPQRIKGRDPLRGYDIFTYACIIKQKEVSEIYAMSIEDKLSRRYAKTVREEQLKTKHESLSL